MRRSRVRLSVAPFPPNFASLLPAILLFSAVSVLLCPNPWLDILVSPPLFHLVLTSVSSARHTHSMHLSGFLRRQRQSGPCLCNMLSLSRCISRGENGSTSWGRKCQTETRIIALGARSELQRARSPSSLLASSGLPTVCLYKKHPRDARRCTG